MEIRIYDRLHSHAVAIRNTVFVEEQGFIDEFDEADGRAIHLVMYQGEEPIGVCRVFTEGETWLLGRFAVQKAWREKGLGSLLLREAEETVRSHGGTTLTLHAQCRAMAFYEKNGYTPFGEIEYEQDCPHMAMKKEL
jgi:predicted GNAT family N-acyltransferase